MSDLLELMCRIQTFSCKVDIYVTLSVYTICTYFHTISSWFSSQLMLSDTHLVFWWINVFAISLLKGNAWKMLLYSLWHIMLYICTDHHLTVVRAGHCDVAWIGAWYRLPLRYMYSPAINNIHHIRWLPVCHINNKIGILPWHTWSSSRKYNACIFMPIGHWFSVTW